MDPSGVFILICLPIVIATVYLLTKDLLTNYKNNKEGRNRKQKRFVCDRCSTEKMKGPEFTATRCPECGEKMTTQENHEVLEKLRKKKREKNKRREKRFKKINKQYIRESNQKNTQRHTKGCVYVLTNPMLSDVVKIGYTKRSAEKRAREISSGTGVVGHWEVAYEIGTARPKRTEKKVHKRLSHQKIQDGGEFFKVEPEEAARVIKKVRG
jgi:hypothetical protein